MTKLLENLKESVYLAASLSANSLPVCPTPTDNISIFCLCFLLFSLCQLHALVYFMATQMLGAQEYLPQRVGRNIKETSPRRVRQEAPGKSCLAGWGHHFFWTKRCSGGWSTQFTQTVRVYLGRSGWGLWGKQCKNQVVRKELNALPKEERMWFLAKWVLFTIEASPPPK